jgi:N-acetylglucosamine malate deacetylase 1
MKPIPRPRSAAAIHAFLPHPLLRVLGLLLLLPLMSAHAAEAKLRIICFGAHPDDCEIQAGGVGALWSAQGHHVKFVSVSNGDIGHWREAGGPLALRRKAEAEAADKLLGVATEILDIHDGEILPTLENRRTIVRLIREWEADIVMAHRPNDYHPDHRYTAILVQDAAYMVTVPFFCPDVPALKRNPVFLYFADNFQKPNPFEADVIVSIDSVLDRKLDALSIMESQFYEGGANGSADLIPTDPAAQRQRKDDIRSRFARRNQGLAERFRPLLLEFYGPTKGNAVKHAEAFEICEYGRRPTPAELRQLFPFFSATP